VEIKEAEEKQFRLRELELKTRETEAKERREKEEKQIRLMEELGGSRSRSARTA
jgi:hypothetical protein